MPLRTATTLWPPVLLGSQFVFNIGFYAVVPFLAIFLRDDMLLSGGLIGLVLGLRTFSPAGDVYCWRRAFRPVWREERDPQRLHRPRGGLFTAGLWAIPVARHSGACLTGVGGALFSPSIEALLAKAGTQSEAKGKRSRAEWFALFAVCGELGAVLGPVMGALLTGLGFRQLRSRGREYLSLRSWCSFSACPRRTAARSR